MIQNLSFQDHASDIVGLFDLFSDRLEGGDSCLQIGCRSVRGFRNFECRLTKIGYSIHHVLEIHGANVDKLKNDIDVIVEGDALLIEQYERLEDSYDVVVWWHGPEHVKKDEFEKALPKIMVRSRLAFIIGCPNGKYDQGKLYGNPHEKHKHHWLPNELERLGFNVYTFGSGKPGQKKPMFGILWRDNWKGISER